MAGLNCKSQGHRRYAILLKNELHLCSLFQHSSCKYWGLASEDTMTACLSCKQPQMPVILYNLQDKISPR